MDQQERHQTGRMGFANLSIDEFSFFLSNENWWGLSLIEKNFELNVFGF